jgi:hypothetical protein
MARLVGDGACGEPASNIFLDLVNPWIIEFLADNVCDGRTVL